ncbi:DUF982 domain-containing protein [Aureimonas altamirensis]|uniref:DUF982 domain-containing protein n=1 Tax=Aureimonas altamirensis TaxID=370622 RepID=UPI0020369609|nr:DUF982 domain-containing protein [Aureimonas altamirensis]MCM2505354.1 DUF982 domain-containing protein [Aureimonas altamirensis]
MEYDVFQVPVRVFFGIGVPRDIVTVTQAYAWLQNCRTVHRTEVHVAAVQACKAAFAKQVNAETVRRSVARFAERSGLMVPDMDVAPATAGIKTPPRLTA